MAVDKLQQLDSFKNLFGRKAYKELLSAYRNGKAAEILREYIGYTLCFEDTTMGLFITAYILSKTRGKAPGRYIINNRKGSYQIDNCNRLLACYGRTPGRTRIKSLNYISHIEICEDDNILVAIQTLYIHPNGSVTVNNSDNIWAKSVLRKAHSIRTSC